jgi:hypothetical protein
MTWVHYLDFKKVLDLIIVIFYMVAAKREIYDMPTKNTSHYGLFFIFAIHSSMKATMFFCCVRQYDLFVAGE